MNSFLYIALMWVKAVGVAAEPRIVLMAIQSNCSSSKIFSESTYKMWISAIKFKGLSSRVEILHIKISVLIIRINGTTTDRKYDRNRYIYIDLVPATMEEVLTKLQGVLAVNPCEEAVLANAVKSLFFGLWNFDKMVNQHLLSTRISELLVKLPRKNALNFFRSFLSLLREKWNLIDHHRINKFMLLVRYLLANSFKLC